TPSNTIETNPHLHAHAYVCARERSDYVSLSLRRQE
ncbi:hypothetical protein AVEN_151605-1, partial [Araneus ventricosus]